MRPHTDSAPAPIDAPPDERDEFPSVIISGGGLIIDDPAQYGNERQEPQFVIDDDQNFTGAAR